MDVKIARTAGFCWGVRRTVDQVMQVADHFKLLEAEGLFHELSQRKHEQKITGLIHKLTDMALAEGVP